MSPTTVTLLTKLIRDRLVLIEGDLRHNAEKIEQLGGGFWLGQITLEDRRNLLLKEQDDLVSTFFRICASEEVVSQGRIVDLEPVFPVPRVCLDPQYQYSESDGITCHLPDGTLILIRG